MANFNALFAGCESFMEGDVEINNDVTVPAGDTAEAVEAEVEATDVGAEGSEIAGDAENEDTKAEATNMVFDQLMSMYRHVKKYGVDRTFLSLYNSNGQLNQMVGYRFPSCESIDSVGSPRSQASRAFIAAMEDDGIFKKIWTWIKETFAKIVNFVIKVMDWFREACGNMDLRIGKLRKYFQNSNNREYEEQKSRSVIYYDSASITRYNEALKRMSDETGQLDQALHLNSRNGPVYVGVAEIGAGLTEVSSTLLDDIAAKLSSRAGEHTGANSYGSARDKDDTHGAEQLKKYADRVQKDLMNPVKDAIKDIAKDKETLETISGSNGLGVAMNANGVQLKAIGSTKGQVDAKALALANLDVAADISHAALGMKQYIEKAKQGAAHARQSAEQCSRLNSGESLSHEENAEARRHTNTAMKGISILSSGMGLMEQLMRKIVKQTASLQGLVMPNHNANP